MKLDTAIEHIRVWSEKADLKNRGFSVTLHVSPDYQVVIEKPIKVKDESELNKLQNIVFE